MARAPPFAENTLGTGTRLIGLMMLANAATVMVAQVPIARFAEGRRRVAMMAAGAALIAVAFLLIASADATGGYAILLVAAITIAIGECFHTAALMPLVADLAPASLRGRYMATMALSWWVGLALAPTLGTQALAMAPAVTFVACAAVAAGAGLSLLRLERHLPQATRLTPFDVPPASAPR